MRVEPLVIEVNNKEYTLEFSRDNVVKINRLGFDIDKLLSNMEEMLPLLFWGSFLLHHPEMKRKDTDKILEAIEGLDDEELAYFIDLYSAPRTAMFRKGERKNSNVTIHLPKSELSEQI